ncbi:MAG: molybdopterin-synthase adenylyltransferase MoeB [Gammaproteobacteria bacterium]|nr:molybdopterin-synthase adenylyltransferase MoeB [Gammaproteobacteria bacterium]|tara:strand:+ start:191672 stop:192454 length:783 start_codon:yes stop_codon:yes gene_type:complete
MQTKNLEDFTLSDKDLLKYNRHILLPEIDIEGQKLLMSKHVVLIGLGGLGSPIAYYLASSGIGNITIIDKDIVDQTNLQRQILYNGDDIGKRKVDIAFERMRDINQDIDINRISEDLNDITDNKYFIDSDLIIDATDNFKTRNNINKLSLIHKKPLVMGAAIKMEGQISIFRNDKKNAPCYNCLYNDLGDDDLSCSDYGVLSTLTGIVGSIQANESIKVLLDIGEKLESKLLMIDAKNLSFKKIKINKDPNCKVCSKKIL